ncbi:MAG: hypothetical protein AAFV53_18130 [Myxococcota bacterium]
MTPLLWGLLACATPKAFYENARLDIAPVSEDSRGYLVNRITNAVDSGRVERIVLDGQPVQTADIDNIPLTGLAAAWTILDDKVHHGAEWDLSIRLEDGPTRIVTVIWEPDDVLRIQLGDDVPTISTRPSAGELKLRYGIGPLKDGDRKWTADQRGALGTALALLSEQERVVIRDMPFVRLREGPTRHVAHYVQRNNRVRIQLYDALFKDDGQAFHGAIDAPYPPSTYGIIHEIGHALASHSVFLLGQQYSAAVEIYNLTAEQLNELGQALNRATPAEQRRRQPEYEAMELKLNAALGLVKTLEARYQRQAKQPPVLQQYVEVRGDREGPTPYGRTSDEESFAEAFALFHIDPAALRRVLPDVYAWMASGGHIQTMNRAIASAQSGE